jgi:hypothetical protein
MNLAVLFSGNLSLKRKLEQRITFATKVKSKSNKNNNKTL